MPLAEMMMEGRVRGLLMLRASFIDSADLLITVTPSHRPWASDGEMRSSFLCLRVSSVASMAMGLSR